MGSGQSRDRREASSMVDIAEACSFVISEEFERKREIAYWNLAFQRFQRQKLYTASRWNLEGIFKSEERVNLTK
ncbi:hypothetical protein MRB53_004931 [Persea americana]|uniref:Uncharacterized protein n=1 Tax=Persea americana TaxID=3435 RepID=A0ACC2MCP1_PERAE|nr:hypothetical protein MRB53_004931 [Persea americana]